MTSKLTPGRLARSFRSGESGASALEFALIAFPLLGTVFCIAEAGLDAYALASLDDVARKISRQIQVGNVQSSNMSAAQLGTQLCNMLTTPLSCSNLFWSVKTVTDFTKLTTSTSQGGVSQYSLILPAMSQSGNAYCPGQGNDYVVVQLLYAIPVISGIWSTSQVSYNGKSVRVLSTSSVFRNEAFGVSKVACQ